MDTLSNKYQIERNYTTNKKARSGQQIKKVLFSVAHETSNNSADAYQHLKALNLGNLDVCAHTYIDSGRILELIPLWEKAWHVQYIKPTDNRLFGDDANDAAIGVELCRTGNFAEAYDRYVWYFAYLCKKFALDPQKHIVSHKTLDPQRRSDPESWLNPNGVTWANFISHVTDYFNRWDEVPASPVTEADSVDGKLVRGESGPNVKQLNLWLKELEYTTKTDDLFDQYTEAALKAFQKDHGLTQDAVYTTAVGDVILKAIADKNKKVELDPVPTKTAGKYRLAKFIDTDDLKLIEQYRKEGYKIIELP